MCKNLLHLKMSGHIFRTITFSRVKTSKQNFLVKSRKREKKGSELKFGQFDRRNGGRKEYE